MGCSSPDSILSVVVLPAPFGPRKPTISPGSIGKRHPVDGGDVASPATHQALRRRPQAGIAHRHLEHLAEPVHADHVVTEWPSAQPTPDRSTVTPADFPGVRVVWRVRRDHVGLVTASTTRTRSLIDPVRMRRVARTRGSMWAMAMAALLLVGCGERPRRTPRRSTPRRLDGDVGNAGIDHDCDHFVPSTTSERDAAPTAQPPQRSRPTSTTVSTGRVRPAVHRAPSPTGRPPSPMR